MLIMSMIRMQHELNRPHPHCAKIYIKIVNLSIEHCCVKLY